jgi:hypothetical protein
MNAQPYVYAERARSSLFGSTQTQANSRLEEERKRKSSELFGHEDADWDEIRMVDIETDRRFRSRELFGHEDATWIEIGYAVC